MKAAPWVPKTGKMQKAAFYHSGKNCYLPKKTNFFITLLLMDDVAAIPFQHAIEREPSPPLTQRPSALYVGQRGRAVTKRNEHTR